MKEKNKYANLLHYSEKDIPDLVEAVYEIVELIKNEEIKENEKEQFYSVIKAIIQRGDFTSYSCVNLLRDIMTKDLDDFLLEELRKSVFTNVPLSIEIMKTISCNGFPEYYDFLNSIKDNTSISLNFRKLINQIIDLDQGKITTFGFPNVYQKSRDFTDIEIDWDSH